MLIDCDSCTARPRSCGDCIVTHLLQVGPARSSTEDFWAQPRDPADNGPFDGRYDGPPVDGWDPGNRAPELTDSEVAAVAVLAAGGLVPPLRLVTPARPAGAAVGSAPRTGRRAPRGRTG